MFILRKPTSSLQWTTTTALRRNIRFISSQSNVITDMTRRGLIANVTR
jgi:hypothetical protein